MNTQDLLTGNARNVANEVLNRELCTDDILLSLANALSRIAALEDKVGALYAVDNMRWKGDKMITDCRICDTKLTGCRNVDLYVTGSEGLTLCHDCEMALVNHVRSLLHLASKVKLETHKRIREKT